MRFRVDLKIFLFLILFYFTKQIEVYAMMMFFAIIHEFGHLFAGLTLGMRPESMEVMPYGVSINFKIMPKDYNEKIKCGNILELKKVFVAIAGPIINVIIMLVSLQFDNVLVSYVNLLLAIFNLLPIYPLDGGRILKAFLHIFLGKRKAERYTNYLSFVSLLIVTFVSSIAIYQLKNIAIFVIVIVLWAIYIREDIIYKKRNKIYGKIDNI